jgi:hypothetical protein
MHPSIAKAIPRLVRSKKRLALGQVIRPGRSAAQASGSETQLCPQSPALGRTSAKKFIEIVVRPDPNPRNCVTNTLPYGTHTPVHADRPEIRMTSELFKAQRIVLRIGREKTICATRAFTVRRADQRERTPETRRCF